METGSVTPAVMGIVMAREGVSAKVEVMMMVIDGDGEL